MTYCVGWKYKNSVFLLADTAATKDLPITHKLSSFGEVHAKVKNEYVEESLLKLVAIAKNAALAFSGDVGLANNIARFLRDSYDEKVATEVLLATVTASLGPFDPSRPVEILLARSHDGISSLVKWNTIDGVNSVESDFHQIGSLKPFHSSITESFVSVLSRGSIPSERVLPIVVAIVQSYGINDNLIDQNVGGLIFGLMVSDGAVSWQDDTSYVVYDQSFASINYVSIFVRDGVVISSSSLNNDIRLFVNSVSTLNINDWLERWEGFLRAHLRANGYRYWVFLKSMERIVTIVRRESLDVPGQLVNISELSPGKFDLCIKQKLMLVLRAKVTDRRDGSVPIRINFLND